MDLTKFTGPENGFRLDDGVLVHYPGGESEKSHGAVCVLTLNRSQ